MINVLAGISAPLQEVWWSSSVCPSLLRRWQPIRQGVGVGIDTMRCKSAKFGFMDADDNTLISRWLAGDDAAGGEIVMRYGECVYRMCTRTCGADFDLAEACAQETWLQAFRKLNTFRGDSSLKAWLCRIAINVSFNQKRGNDRSRIRDGTAAREKANTGTDIDSATELPFVVIVDPNPDPAEDAAKSEERKCLQDALLKLSARCRSILILRYFDGFKLEEIAEMIGLSLSSIQKDSRPCLKELEDILQHSSSGGVKQDTGI